jgi:hypothetical protein
MIRRDGGTYLRTKAAEYRRRAASINQPTVAAQLTAMACQLEQQLEHAESEGLLAGGAGRGETPKAPSAKQRRDSCAAET